MPQKERVAIIVVAIAGVLALGLGLWRMKYIIKTPFLLKPGSFKQATKNSTSIIDAQTKDTDKDGLTDFDELYIYKSSPYLKDSDSDGDDDYKEVKAKTDPNCPKGRACEEKSTTSNQPLIGSSIPNSPLQNSPSSLNLNTGAAGTQTIQSISNLSIKDIKTLLKSAGMKDEQIRKFDDKTLMTIYKEALEKTQK